MSDEFYIRRTLELAKCGLGTTWPNPMVGAVIVKDGRLIAEGFHLRAGEDHAELAAIKKASESLEGATIYVNLEPCCHTHKRTPPCAQRLIQEKFKRVVICNLDPNPQVFGKGVELLRGHGILVDHGILADEGEELNEVFFHAQRKNLPFVHLKLASSLDGRIALPTGESQWITGEKAREHVHYLRSQYQAIAIGANTLRKDNPKLNVRLDSFKGPQPTRIVFTESGQVQGNFTLFNDEEKEKTIVYSKSKLNLPLPSENMVLIHQLEEALKDLYQRKIISLMLEGGAKLASQFMQQKLIHRVSHYINPSFLGRGPASMDNYQLQDLNSRPKLKNVKYETLGDDLYLTGRMF